MLIPVAGPRSLEGVRILLVEDDDDIRELLKLALSSRGAVLTAVDSTRAAVAAIDVERPDIVISDITMPGEDGHALMRKVRGLPLTRGGRVPAIALTALDTREARVASRDAGFHYHLTKPVDANKLVAIVADLVRLTGT
jgi:DNA-binding response OmpR family regulator